MSEPDGSDPRGSADQPSDDGWADRGWADEVTDPLLDDSADPVPSPLVDEAEPAEALPDQPTSPSTDGPSDPPAVADTPWRSLHPLSLAVNLLPQAWRTARAAWPLLLVVVFGGAGTGLEAVDLSLLVAFFVLTIARTVTHFLTLRYRVHDGRFEVRSGLLNRRARVLDPARIQNIEAVQNLFHKAAGLVEVRVETAGDASTQGLLSALGTDEAHQLEQELKTLVRAARGGSSATAGTVTGTDEATTEDDDEGDVLVNGSTLEALAYGLSRRTVGTVAVLTFVGFEILGRMGPQAADEARWIMQPQVFVPALLLAFAGSWAWSAGRALLSHWRFRLRRRGDRLISEEGLTTRRRVEIPLEKVQLIRVDEPLTRRLMGYGTVLIETAALGFADGELRQAEGVVPMVAQNKLPSLVHAAAPRISADPWSMELRPPHRRALHRAVFVRTVRSMVLAGLLVGFMRPWGWAALVLLPLAPLLAWLDWRWQGWAITEDAVVTRQGVLRRATHVLARDKIQSVQVLQPPLMQLHGLARVIVRVAGTAVALPDIGIDQALRVLQELSPDPTAMPSADASPGARDREPPGTHQTPEAPAVLPSPADAGVPA